MIKEAIVKIVNKQDLTFEEAYTVMNEIMSGETSPTQNAAFLAALSTKSARAETTEEITGCATAMREKATRVEAGDDLFEIVGTGGDGAHSFNISTTSALVAAAGGMLFPALIYLLLCPHGENSAAHGWGIPTATDIAFVVGCMAILGRKVPHALRVMILTLAIADDIGAILVIAIGYPSGDGINFLALGSGFALLVLINVLFRIGVRNLLLHGVIGVAVWAFFVKSGVHPTIAGVLLGLSVPAKPVLAKGKLANFAGSVGGKLSGETKDRNEQYEVFTLLKRGARESISMQERLFKPLVPWVNFFIMPLFALSNAGVEIKLGGVEIPVMGAVALALIFGKPIGIFLFSLLAVKVGVSVKPSYSWKVLWGGGMLAGIGFTMALFVANLAFDVGDRQDSAKLGILLGSFCAAILGTIYMSIVSKKE